MKKGKKFTAALTAYAVVAALALPTVASAAPSFSDIGSSYAQQAILDLASQGIINGYNGQFNPTGKITRQDFAIVLAKSLGLTATAGATSQFSDVAPYAQAYVKAAVDAGLISGYPNGNFGGSDNLTREQMAALFVRALHYVNGYDATGKASNLNFADAASINPNFKDAVGAAVELGLITGYTQDGQTYFNPQGTAERQAVALVASKFMTAKVAGLKLTASATKAAIGTAVKFSITGTNDAVTWSVDKNGVIDQSGNFVGTTSGTAVVTATVDGKTLTQSINVYGEASALKVANVSDLVANGASTETITINAVDASGNVASDYTGDVNVTLGADLAYADGTAGTTRTLTAVNGVVTFNVVTNAQYNTTAATSISVASGSLTGDVASLNVTAPVATKVALTTATPSAEANAGATIPLTATLYDQTGNVITANGPVVVALSSSDTSKATVDTNVTIANGSSTGNATVTYVAAGAVTVNPGAVTANGVATTAISVAPISVNFGASSEPAKFVTLSAPTSSVTANGTVTIKVALTDANGILKEPVSGPPATITLTDASGNVAKTAANASISVVPSTSYANGVYTFVVQPATAGTFTYSIDATGMTSATGSVTVVPATADHLSAVTASAPIINADGKATSTLSVTAQDAYGNTVTSFNGPVTFVKSTDNGATTLPATTTVNAVNGVASIVVTATTKGGIDTFNASTSATMVTSATAANTATVQTAVVGVPAQLAVTGGTTSTVAAGSSVAFTVAVKDANGTVIYADNSTPVTVTLKDSTGAVIGTGTATDQNGVATVSVPVTKAGTYANVTATSGNLAEADVTTATVQVTPLTATTLKLSSDVTTAAAVSNSTVRMTVTAVDKYGNTDTNYTGTANLTASGNAYGYFANGANDQSVINTAVSIVNGVGNTTASNDWTVQANKYGTTNFTVSVSDGSLTAASASVNSVYTQAASKLVATAPANVTISNDASHDGSKNLQQVTLSLEDINGRVETATTATGGATLTITDNNGGTVSPNVKVYADAAGTTPVTLTANSGNVDVNKGTITFYVSNDVAQTLNYSVTTSSITGSTTGTFNPGAVNKVMLTASGSTLKADGSSVVKFTANLADFSGNSVKTGSGNVTFALSDTTKAKIVGSPTVSFVNGVATITVQSIAGQTGSFTLTATPADSTITAGTSSAITLF